MNWFKKSQNREIAIVKNILDNNLDIDTIKAKLQSLIRNPCDILSQLCDGNPNVPAFYMTVWQQLCSSQVPQQTEIEEEIV